MTFHLSPNYTNRDVPDEWTTDIKVELFIDRVESYQLSIAEENISREIPNRGPALLYILMSYFEMIGKYMDGYTKDNQSRVYFKRGVREVFPDIEPEMEEFIDKLYERVRCGLYHVGMPKEVVVGETEMGSIGYNTITELIWINPDCLLSDIKLHFSRFVEKMRDPNNFDLRRKFEARFDFDNP